MLRFDFRVQKDHPAAQIRMCLVSGHRNSDKRRKGDTQFAQTGSGQTAKRQVRDIQTNEIVQRADRDPINLMQVLLYERRKKEIK